MIFYYNCGSMYLYYNIDIILLLILVHDRFTNNSYDPKYVFFLLFCKMRSSTFKLVYKNKYAIF